MKVLFITHHYLSSNGGGSFASRAFINAFAGVADELTLLYPIKEGEDVFPEINAKIQRVPVAYNFPKWRKLLCSITGHVHRYYKVAENFLLERCADIVVFDTSVVTDKLISRFKEHGYKVVVIHHNYQYEYFKDNCRGLLKWVTLFWCRKYECEAVRNADINLTLTQQDVDLLSNEYNGGDKSTFKVLGVFEYCRKPKKDLIHIVENRNKFVITGNLSSVQTFVSLEKWIKDYYPLMKSVFPEASLTIAGKNPSLALMSMCQKYGICVIPSPSDMDVVLRDADYYICPTFLGGGLKLRIMDGLQWGLPVISHIVSARGYDSFVERGLMFVYSNKEEFAISLMKLKVNALNKQNVQNAYSDLFSYESGVNRVRSIVDVFN